MNSKPCPFITILTYMYWSGSFRIHAQSVCVVRNTDNWGDSYENVSSLKAEDYYINIGCTRNCHPEKTNVDQGEVHAIGFLGVTISNVVTPLKPMSTSESLRATLVFSGLQFPMLPSRAVNIYILLNVSQPIRINYFTLKV